jgi:hypothetical protein
VLPAIAAERKKYSLEAAQAAGQEGGG